MATDVHMDAFRDEYADHGYLPDSRSRSARLLIHSRPESSFSSDIRVTDNPVSFDSKIFSSGLPEVSSPESLFSHGLSVSPEVNDGRSTLIAALTMPEPGFPGLADRKHSFLHRSLPNLAEACAAALQSDSPLSVPAKYEEDCSSTMDCEMDSISAAPVFDCVELPIRTKLLARKGSDSDSTVSSILTTGRKKISRRIGMFKRIKTSDANAFPMDADEEASVSSAAELERFFDSMGLEDQQGFQTGRSVSRTLHLQVSDDAIESEEDQLESISIIGVNTAGIQPLVETDDDEPEVTSETPTPTAPKVFVNRHTETISLRNARISKWLVGCRGDIRK